MRKLLAVLAALFLGAPAYGQSAQQSGAVTPGHVTCWVTTGVIADCGLGVTELTNGIFIILLNTLGHTDITGVAPALGTCGTTPTISGTDLGGLVTMGTGSPTGCVITFANAWISTPYCTVTWQATPLASQSYTVTTTAITLVQTGTSSNKVNYHCDGQSGG